MCVFYTSTHTNVPLFFTESYEWLNNSYYFKSNGMKWEASKDECKSYGGWLADIYSQAENDFLVQTTDQLSGPPPYNGTYVIFVPCKDTLTNSSIIN